MSSIPSQQKMDQLQKEIRILSMTSGMSYSDAVQYTVDLMRRVRELNSTQRDSLLHAIELIARRSTPKAG